MKAIGLIGGMSWESSMEYYRMINEGVRERLGGLHSAQCVMVSVDFAPIEVLQREGRWAESGELLADAARGLEQAGAQCVVLCTNTMHKLAGQMMAEVHIPLIHIADATAAQVCQAGIHTVGLLGTRFTMQEDFYKGRLADPYGLEVLIPGEAEMEIAHRIIYDELCLGQIRAASRAAYRQIIAGLVARGAQGIILGCTEIGMLVKAEDSAVPLFDTTVIHAQEAVAWALRE